MHARLRPPVPFEYYRNNLNQFAVAKPSDPGPAVGSESSVSCPVPGGEIEIVVYRPQASNTTESKLWPACLHVHGKSQATIPWFTCSSLLITDPIIGGGFVGGSARMDAPWLRTIVAELGIVALSVDYRLAPEHPAPVPSEDVWAALQYVSHTSASHDGSGASWSAADRDPLGWAGHFAQVVEHAEALVIDRSRLIVGGISAGANLATLAVSRAVEAGIDVLLQVLVVPVTDLDAVGVDGQMRDDTPHRSWIEMADNPILSRERMLWFYSSYLGPLGQVSVESGAVESTLSPMRLRNLARKPPTFIATAEIDILRVSAPGPTIAPLARSPGM